MSKKTTDLGEHRYAWLASHATHQVSSKAGSTLAPEDDLGRTTNTREHSLDLRPMRLGFHSLLEISISKQVIPYNRSSLVYVRKTTIVSGRRLAFRFEVRFALP